MVLKGDLQKEHRTMANPEHLAKLKEGVEAWNDCLVLQRGMLSL
jgi:hypothetical protein